MGKAADGTGGSDVERAERSLKEAVILARDRMAERDDVVVDLKASERGRLELLVEELRPLIDDVDPADERFEFGLSHGDRPRFWLDATAYVQMGNDRRTYRLLKDRLHDRRLLAETGDLDVMADATSAYIAERVLDRKRVMDGEWENVRESRTAPTEVTTAKAASATTVQPAPRKRRWWKSMLSGFLQVLAGVAIVAAILAALVWFFPGYFPD